MCLLKARYRPNEHRTVRVEHPNLTMEPARYRTAVIEIISMFGIQFAVIDCTRSLAVQWKASRWHSQLAKFLMLQDS